MEIIKDKFFIKTHLYCFIFSKEVKYKVELEVDDNELIFNVILYFAEDSEMYYNETNHIVAFQEIVDTNIPELNKYRNKK